MVRRHGAQEVTGAPRADVAPGDVLRSAFPAGTLSGAPKVRAMQIIREVERDARGVYGGAVGELRLLNYRRESIQVYDRGLSHSSKRRRNPQDV